MATPALPAAMDDGASRHVIAVIAFDRISPFHLSVPCVVFGEERSGGDLPDFDFRVCAAESGTLTTTAGTLNSPDVTIAIRLAFATTW